MGVISLSDEFAQEKILELYPGSESQLADRPRYYCACASMLCPDLTTLNKGSTDGGSMVRDLESICFANSYSGQLL